MRASLWLRHARQHRQRDPQRGNTLLLALIVMSALAALGSLTVISVQSSLKASTHDRAQTVALYAAESGAAYAIQHLRETYDYVYPYTGWSSFVKPSNDPAQVTDWGAAELPESGAQPGSPDNPFSDDQQAWFTVKVLNNRDDREFATGFDSDGRVIVQVTGHGPQGATAIVEWDIQRGSPTAYIAGTPSVPAYPSPPPGLGSGASWPPPANPPTPFPVYDGNPTPTPQEVIRDLTPTLSSWTWFAPMLDPNLGPHDDRRSPVILRGYRIVSL